LQLQESRAISVGFAADTTATPDRGVLRPDLPVEDARDTLWTLNSLAVHDLLVVQRGWSVERYGDWLAAALVVMLLQ
jgi:hypothetical protein